jgi:hypothetical protein
MNTDKNTDNIRKYINNVYLATDVDGVNRCLVAKSSGELYNKDGKLMQYIIFVDVQKDRSANQDQAKLFGNLSPSGNTAVIAPAAESCDVFDRVSGSIVIDMTSPILTADGEVMV